MKTKHRTTAQPRRGRQPHADNTGPAPVNYSLTAILVAAKSSPPSRRQWLRLLSHLALFGLLVNLLGCGLFDSRDRPEPQPEIAPLIAPVPAPQLADDSTLLRGRLYQHYKLWKGTPYRMGGMTTRGIDCSGFVLITFKALLDVRLPRTVDEQATLGRGIAPAELRSGDLVFFQTGATLRHVGIYLERGRFMHASTRGGVMISLLADGYWRQRFWQARRIRTPQIARAVKRGSASPSPSGK